MQKNKELYNSTHSEQTNKHGVDLRNSHYIRLGELLVLFLCLYVCLCCQCELTNKYV